MSENKNCTPTDTQKLHCSVPVETLFILRPRPTTAKLPYRLESGDLITTDGRWVQIRSASAQTFYRTGKRFRIGKYSCYVGKSLPFVEKYQRKLILLFSACGLLLVTLLTTDFLPVTGLASLPSNPAPGSLPTPTDSQLEIETADALAENAAIEKESAGASTQVKKTQQKGHRNQLPDLDPLRCKPIPNKPIPKVVLQASTKTEEHSRGWYVCR